MERLWLEVVDTVDVPRARVVERVARRLGVGQATARLLGVTPSLQLSWLVGIAVVLAFAASAAYSGDAGTAAFLLVAPMVPVAGVAAAFGPGADRAFEIAAAAPLPALRLVLVRAAALLATSLVLTGAAALALPGLGWTATAWILPSFGVTLATLALSTAMTPERAAVAVATGWVVLVSAGAGAAGEWLAPLRDARSGDGRRGRHHRRRGHRYPPPYLRRQERTVISSVSMRDLSKSYGRVRAVDSVSMEAGFGVTGLLGPNGAGKTTLLRMLATVLTPDGGRLELLGHDPADPAGRIAMRRRLGYVPQEPGLYPNFTAFEFVDYVAILKEMTQRRDAP